MIQTLFIILLLEGFITISVEMLAIRQLLPFFGGSVLITSIIIGIFLLFLAIGYWRGGQKEVHFYKALTHNFSWSMIWIGLGFSYLFIVLFFFVTAQNLHLPILLCLTLYLLFILAPVVYWLGQTIPLTTNLFNQELRTAHISGRALFISTIGSFLGAILTTLLLFQYLGVAWTVIINCLLLFFLIWFLKQKSQSSWTMILLLFVSILFIVYLNQRVEKDLFIKTNNYANYAVNEFAPFNKIFRINESASSLLTEDNKGFPYIEFVKKYLFHDLKLHNKSILIIGAGGFTLTANGNFNNKVTYLDLDPDIKNIAENFFLHKEISDQFIGQDARQFFIQSNQVFDVIFSDAYSNRASIPPSLLTKEYFNAIANHLKPKGLFIANIIANPLFNDQYSQRVYKTIQQVFPFCTIVPIETNKQAANLIYICPNIQDDNGIYTDDKNQSTTDFWFFRQS